MSFDQVKLNQIADQSSSIFNVYIYRPDNGDTIADISASDYFAQSQYIGDDGWVNGLIHVVADDGYGLFQIQSDGTTGVAIYNNSSTSGLQAQIDDLDTRMDTAEESIELIDDNLRSVVFIDMDDDDYTMTDEEANAYQKVLSNTGDGTKTLTWPSTSDSTIAIQQSVYATNGNGCILARESGGASGFIGPNSVSDINIISVGVFVMSNIYGTQIRQKTNGVSDVTDVSYTFVPGDAGKLIVGDNALAQAFGIDTNANQPMPDDAVIYIQQAGAGVITVSALAGVTLIGDGVFVADQRKTLNRKGSTDTWVIG